MTAPTAEPQKEARKKTRIAHLLLPEIDAHSALLPPDKWILATARDFVRHNKSFHNTIGRAALYAGGGLLAVAGGLAAVALLPLTLPVAAGGLLALGASLFAGLQAKIHIEKFKSETLPELRNAVGKKYLEYKMSELKSAWQKNVDARRRKKEAEKKATVSVAKDKKPTAVAPVNNVPATVPAPGVSKAAANKNPKKNPLGDAFGALAKKMAEDRANKAPRQEPPKPPQP